MVTTTWQPRGLLAAILMVGLTTSVAAKSGDVYFETFDEGPGGWVANRHEPLPVWDGVAYCFGPWYLDSHHAYPGKGCLHMLMWLLTKTPGEKPFMLPNRFIDQHHSTNLTDARLSVRLRGDIDLQGAQLLLLAQGRAQGTTANLVLSGQPFKITRDWSEQTVTLAPDPGQWTCLGARESMKHTYGCADVAAVLKDVNVDIIFVLFPLKIVPVGEAQDPDKLRPGQDYPGEPSYQVWQKYLPKGLVMFDWVKIVYAR